MIFPVQKQINKNKFWTTEGNVLVIKIKKNKYYLEQAGDLLTLLAFSLF